MTETTAVTGLKEQLQELERMHPEGLSGDVHYLAGLINYSDAYRKQEIGSTIRMWELNLRKGCSKPEEVKEIIDKLKSLIDYKG